MSIPISSLEQSSFNKSPGWATFALAPSRELAVDAAIPRVTAIVPMTSGMLRTLALPINSRARR
jgi:hypothetical protein